MTTTGKKRLKCFEDLLKTLFTPLQNSKTISDEKKKKSNFQV